MTSKTKTLPGHRRRPCAKQRRRGSAYVMAMMSIFVLSALGAGMLSVAWQQRRQASKLKNETISMLAAKAGYEKAVFWMSQQPDMLTALRDKAAGSSGSLSFRQGQCDYSVELHGFAGSRPIYRVLSHGVSGKSGRMVDVLVVQAVSGWDMGMCRVPAGGNKTYPVYFADGEVIDTPIHINKLDDSPDYRDIYIKGQPEFRQRVGMGEARTTAGGADKYASVIGLFGGGIYFEQPETRITDEESIAAKVQRFRSTTKPAYTFEPVAKAKAKIKSAQPAVQLEFFVNEQGAGKVRITNNCTVRGFKQGGDYKTWDFKIKEGTDGTNYVRYYIYAYHVADKKADKKGERITANITDTYVSQTIGGTKSPPGGQIFVDGNVVIGGDRTADSGDQVVKGKITVVATGNIWVADSIHVAGPHDADGMPSKDNPNILGLIAQGVVKVVDPGMTTYSYIDRKPVEPKGFEYRPIGRADAGQPEDSYRRHLPDPMVVEASITVGGGGWGAENVRRGNWGGRKQDGGITDALVVRGTIVEAIRGVVGLIGADGYVKHYYMDERLLQGILPGDVWLQGKYVPAPAGWRDYSAPPI